MFVEDSVISQALLAHLHLKGAAFLFSPSKDILGLSHNDIEITTISHISVKLIFLRLSILPISPSIYGNEISYLPSNWIRCCSILMAFCAPDGTLTPSPKPFRKIIMPAGPSQAIELKFSSLQISFVSYRRLMKYLFKNFVVRNTSQSCASYVSKPMGRHHVRRC